MEEQELLVILYDYYGELFSDNQKDYFEWYYFDNLSLSEIAENVDKSRNAIHKCIKGVCSKLYEYENILGLYRKSKQLEKIIDVIDDKNIKNRLKELL